jgi:glyoxylase-like metal-dependent hydrolase (beta-lactamase superfamily II)
MSPTVDVISIGTLSRNTFWDERATVRASHATTTLIRDGDATILVDPSLPPELLRHRLDERAGIEPEKIDAVFLTSFLPVHRRGLRLFPEAIWYLSEVERETMVASLTNVLEGASTGGAEVSLEEIQEELEILGRIEICPDQLSDGVDFFPSFGATPGSGSLIVKGAKTVLVAGDAVITRAHFVSGRVWERSSDPRAAKESFAELSEIADVIVPGHDNIMLLA